MKKEFNTERLKEISEMERDNSYILEIHKDNIKNRPIKNIFLKVGEFVYNHISIILVIICVLQGLLKLMGISQIGLVILGWGIFIFWSLIDKDYFKNKKDEELKIEISKNKFKKPTDI